MFLNILSLECRIIHTIIQIIYYSFIICMFYYSSFYTIIQIFPNFLLFTEYFSARVSRSTTNFNLLKIISSLPFSVQQIETIEQIHSRISRKQMSQSNPRLIVKKQKAVPRSRYRASIRFTVSFSSPFHPECRSTGDISSLIRFERKDIRRFLSSSFSQLVAWNARTHTHTHVCTRGGEPSYSYQAISNFNRKTRSRLTAA